MMKMLRLMFIIVMYKEAFPPAVETTLRDKDDDDEGEGGLR